MFVERTKVNEAGLEWATLDEDGTTLRRKKLGEAGGGDRLGCSFYELPAGERSWPYHYHTGNEESLYVLDGRGRLRVGGGSVSLSPGDYVALRRTSPARTGSSTTPAGR